MKTCKCEHWAVCPVCKPEWFDRWGNRLPPEPTPLQAANKTIEDLKQQLADQGYFEAGAASRDAEIAELREQLAAFHSAVEHVTEDGCTRRSFVAMPEGWAMLRVALERLVTERRAGLASLEGWDAAREALAATTDLKCVILCHAEPCRDDGRCQYAIDHGAEGLGHCPEGKCCMPRYSPKGLK